MKMKNTKEQKVIEQIKRMLDVAGVSYRKVPAFEVEIKKENQ